MIEISLITIVFVITLAMLIAGVARIVSIVLPGSNLTLPAVIPLTNINPGHGAMFYPSLAFQVWFWADKLGVFL